MTWRPDMLGARRCEVCGWMGPRKDREVNRCEPHAKWVCAPCFKAGKC